MITVLTCVSMSSASPLGLHQLGLSAVPHTPYQHTAYDSACTESNSRGVSRRPYQVPYETPACPLASNRERWLVSALPCANNVARYCLSAGRQWHTRHRTPRGRTAPQNRMMLLSSVTRPTRTRRAVSHAVMANQWPLGAERKRSYARAVAPCRAPSFAEQVLWAAPSRRHSRYYHTARRLQAYIPTVTASRRIVVYSMQTVAALSSHARRRVR